MLFDEETLFTYIGYAAGLATILTFTIQILKIIETKKITNLSSYMYIIYNLGLVCWFAYGIYIDNTILIVANVLTFLFTFAILMLIIYYDAEDKIERARRDELTCAFNRKYFEQTVPVKIAEAKTIEQNFAILMIKAVNYQAITENYGKKSSTKVLKAIAKFLEKDLRENDIVARFENNKFIVFLADANDKSAELVATRLYNHAKNVKTKISKSEEINIEINVGACSSQHAENMETLIANADKALSSISSRNKKKINIFE